MLLVKKPSQAGQVDTFSVVDTTLSAVPSPSTGLCSKALHRLWFLVAHGFERVFDQSHYVKDSMSMISSLKIPETNTTQMAKQNRPSHKDISSSNHWISGALFVSGSVDQRKICPSSCNIMHGKSLGQSGKNCANHRPETSGQRGQPSHCGNIGGPHKRHIKSPRTLEVIEILLKPGFSLSSHFRWDFHFDSDFGRGSHP